MVLISVQSGLCNPNTNQIDREKWLYCFKIHKCNYCEDGRLSLQLGDTSVYLQNLWWLDRVTPWCIQTRHL